MAFNHEVCTNCRWRCFESPIFDKATWLWKQTQIADVWTEISLTLKYELQPTAIWEISTYFSFCHLVAGRKYSAYEESDGFAGPRAILPQIIQIQVKVVKNNIFSDELSVTKDRSSKTIVIHAYRDTPNRDMAQFNLCFRVAFLAVLLPLTSGEHCIGWNQ